jgi:hypothetical protein
LGEAVRAVLTNRQPALSGKAEAKGFKRSLATAAIDGGKQRQAAKPAFLKNRRRPPGGKQKPLIILASACPEKLSHVSQKFFGSFFQKRTAFCLV